MTPELTSFSPQSTMTHEPAHYFNRRGAILALGAVLALGGASACTVQQAPALGQDAIGEAPVTPVAEAPAVQKAPKTAQYAPYGVNADDQMHAGDRGPKVAKLRSDLMVLKCAGVTAGNVADAPTWAAVHTFQHNVGLAKDKNSVALSVGPKTAKEIAAALRAKNVKCGATAVKHTVAPQTSVLAKPGQPCNSVQPRSAQPGCVEKTTTTKSTTNPQLAKPGQPCNYVQPLSAQVGCVQAKTGTSIWAKP